ncbi:TRAF3-interacting protein 1 [Venturia canescens]|uniref:TRAF3-interacting protein 1 n=1 Tax=Venturia canescens TaxID=32260 RepID=UPI001C9C8104|nr:TRAF3-interacting protein 1 [Venturia canescens]
MADEIKPEIIKKTQKSLGKYVKKPPLTEKLLRKPPFRFLHDIITTVIKETGFLDNLFTDEELNSDIRDKEAKVAYLTKLINVVKLITGNELTVRPSKVVAGQEPAKTNELLQAIAKALDKNISSAEAVQHYKASLEKDSSKPAASKGSKRESLKAGTGKRTERAKGIAEKQDPALERKASRVSPEKNPKERGSQENVNSKETKASNQAKQSKKTKVVDNPQRKGSASVSTENLVGNRKAVITSPKRPPRIESTQENGTTKAPASSSPPPDNKNSEETTSATLKTDPVPLSLEKNEEAAKTPVVPVADAAVEKKPETTPQSVPEPSAPVSREPLRSAMNRPSSARPAAPKLRWKSDISMKHHEPVLAENENVIVEIFNEQNDDADNMVVLETDPTDYAPVMNVPENISGDDAQEHGYLVAQILETQRELAKDNSVDLMSHKVDNELKRTATRNPEAVVKEVESLRSTVQTLIRATHPMGKLLDFLQEDVELMQKELAEWRSKFGQYRTQLEVATAESQATAHPYQESFDSIQAAINDQLDKIYQIKLNITKNNQKIQQLLSGRA